MTFGPASRPDRTPGAARVAGLLGVLGLGVASWLDTWAQAQVARVAFVVWASCGIGVFTAGVITQYERARRERASAAHTRRERAVAAHALGDRAGVAAARRTRAAGPLRTPHNEGSATGLLPAPRQESPHGVRTAQ